jgi:hypothetical protein
MPSQTRRFIVASEVAFTARWPRGSAAYEVAPNSAARSTVLRWPRFVSYVHDVSHTFSWWRE